MTPQTNPWYRRVLFVAALIGAVVVGLWVVRASKSPAKPEALDPSNRDTPRIVALSPALAITLKDLGLAGRIVGRHGFDLALDKSIPVCGDQSGIDYEALIRVHPTHILTQWGAREIPAKLSALANERGWRLHDFPQLTLDDVLDTTLRLGLLFAEPDQTVIPRPDGAATPSNRPVQSACAELVRRMRAAWFEKHPPLNCGRILLLESIDPPAALGPGSFHHQILERIGGTPAITAGKPYITLDAEDILRLAPDGIILLAPVSSVAVSSPAAAAGDAADLRVRLGRIGTLDIPANRNGHLALISDPFCLTPSSALLGVTEQMERILKSWQPTP